VVFIFYSDANGKENFSGITNKRVNLSKIAFFLYISLDEEIEK